MAPLCLFCGRSLPSAKVLHGEPRLDVLPFYGRSLLSAPLFLVPPANILYSV